MRTVDYIELRAKALVSELSQAWDFEKRRELREVLNDLENAEESPSNAIPFGQLELVESDLETKQTCTKLPRKPRGYREGYINNVLDYIEERVLELAHYIIDTNSTVRAAAKKFRVSKSTVHKDVTERLLEINPGLAADVKAVLENNKAERHLRGGMATREKYQHAKEK